MSPSFSSNLDACGQRSAPNCPEAFVPLLSPEAARKAKQALFACGLTPEAFLETAAERVWCALRSRPAPAHVSKAWLVLTGPGHTGAIGWAVARKAAESGVHVSVVPLASERKPLTEAQRRLALAQGVCERANIPSEAALSSHSMIVDALFGVELTEHLPPEAQALVRTLERFHAQSFAPKLPVVALDVPSGLCARTGRVLGKQNSCAVQASETYVLGAHKTGLLCERALRFSGKLHFLPLGFANARAADAALLNFPLRFDFLSKQGDEHKLSRGEALVVAGSPAFPGAGLLALEGLCALSPGYVRLATRSAALKRRVLASRPEIIHGGAGEHFFPRARVGVFGCGLPEPLEEEGEHWAQAVPSEAVCVLDGAWCLPHVVSRFRDKGTTVVVTPHAREFSRLCPDIAQDLQCGKLSKADAASEAARALKCFVLLKGPYSACASPEGRVLQSLCVDPSLARAGTGDTLAGVLAGVLLHGRFAKIPVLELIAFAVELHSRASPKATDTRASARSHIANIARCVAQNVQIVF
ncbi:MAG: hypothetical protein IOD12_07700 [Silvanigrellales bacterium]|nr:hypothetical protein [Silvanigrellales bacterium]